MDGWMDGWIDVWMNGWMDGWMDGWTCALMIRWVSECMRGDQREVNGRRAADGQVGGLLGRGVCGRVASRARVYRHWRAFADIGCWMASKRTLGSLPDTGPPKIVSWRAPGGAGSAKTMVSVAPEAGGSTKQVFGRLPGAAGSTKILAWRLPGGGGSTKIMVWRLPGGAG